MVVLYLDQHDDVVSPGLWDWANVIDSPDPVDCVTCIDVTDLHEDSWLDHLSFRLKRLARK
jgi:hypothetical protein